MNQSRMNDTIIKKFASIANEGFQLASSGPTLLPGEEMYFTDPSLFPEFHPEILWAIDPLIIFINFMIMLTIQRTKRLHITANYFVFAMASCDLFVGCVLLPFLAISPESPPVAALVMFTLLLSLGFSCSCTYDRLIAVLHAAKYNKLIGKKKALWLISFVCILSVILTLIPQLWDGEDQFRSSKRHKNYITSIVALVITCTCCEAISYVAIFVVARRHSRRMQQQRKESLKSNRSSRTSLMSQRSSLSNHKSVQVLLENIRLAKAFMLVALTLFLFWFPLGYINIVDDIMGRPDLMPKWLQEISFYSTFFSCLIHPILYGLFQTKLRKAMLGLMPNWMWCRSGEVILDGTSNRSSSSNKEDDQPMRNLKSVVTGNKMKTIEDTKN